MSKQVDVLTLSATPIPRTLNMALSGIRDMSTLEEPPADRQPVQTYVLEHDWSVLADAMRRELERGGQVYYLHNRVETIERTAARIREMLGGDVAVAVAHGKMSQEELERRNDPHVRRGDRRAGVHHHHRDGHRHRQREHPHHRGRRQAGPGPAPPDPGPGGPLHPAGLRLSDLPHGARCSARWPPSA